MTTALETIREDAALGACVVCGAFIPKRGGRYRSTCSPECLHAVRTRPEADLAERFWSKVDKSAGLEGCWPFTAKLDKDGYGDFWDGRTMVGAHRIAWLLTNGPVPAGMGVLHHCDNPPCCNPADLFLGTNADNARDMAAKGRNTRRYGEAHHSAKLTRADVEEIRRLYVPRRGVGALAARFGVKRDTIRRVAIGEDWR